MKLMNIGFGNMISAQRLLDRGRRPTPRPLSGWCRRRGSAECSSTPAAAEKPSAVLVMDTDHVVLSGLAPETIAHRAGVELEQEPEEE